MREGVGGAMSNLDRILKEAEPGGWLAFERHEITRERFGLWRCAKPGTVRESFWVASAAPALVIFGDLGELIFLPHAANSLRWAAGTKWDPANPYYPMTKVSQRLDLEEFSIEEATAFLEECVEECKASSVLDEEELERYSSMLERWRSHALDDPREAEAEWWGLWSEFGDPDAPDCRFLKSGVCVTWIALCWFMRHVSESDPRFAEELRP